ncbi:MAG TPA: DHHA1 domain-containing protein, partial [Pyrinomonadaceae bacterium]|nr:DHHA1 domain-containing protein [Pyrinomonadaceae bacterium]
LGPRINAAGRMDAARAVVELFEAEDAGTARRIAERLDALNRERQEVQRQVTERALAELEFGGEELGPVAVAAGEGWHRGVIGIAASKISERTGRPAVVISLDDDGTGHGSARSAGNFHMLDALTECADLLETFGGHAHAAGLVVRRENVAELRRRLSAHASRVMCEAGGTPCLEIDMELEPAALSLELCRDLSALEPFGAGWPRPVFVTRDLRVVGEPRMMKGRHLKFSVAAPDGRVHEVLRWNAVDDQTATPRTGQRIELAYTVEANTWQDTTRLQLVAEDMKAGDE